MLPNINMNGTDNSSTITGFRESQRKAGDTLLTESNFLVTKNVYDQGYQNKAPFIHDNMR